MPDNLKENILFLSVPESLRGQIENSDSDNENNFHINPDIPIPAEIPEGRENFNLEELSWEMIISGMLRVIADGMPAGPGSLAGAIPEVNPGWIDYYRHFVISVRPNILGEFTEAAILKARNGSFDLALEILDSLRGLFPFSPAVMLNRALVLEQRAAFLEEHNRAEAPEAFLAAHTAYEKTLSLHPDFQDALFNAGFFCLNGKDFCRAREYFYRYAEIADDEMKIQRAQSIIKDIDENGLDDENFREAYEYIRQGKDEDGLRCIRGFLENHPAVWNGWFVLGWALRRLSRWEDGAAAFGKALELGGAGSDIRNELAICLMESGDLKSARRELEAALYDDPENIKIISNLGVLAMKNGNADEAAAFFRTVLEIDPEDAIANKFFDG
jgi:tetratricopeptide (TPR) repeat protein